MPQALDLRRYIRVPVERPVYVTTHAEGPKSQAIWSFELGEGGCLLVSDDFFGVGRILVIDVCLDARRPVRAIGKILYEYRDLNQRVCSGVEFQYIECDHLDTLRSYINIRMPAESDAASA